MGQFILLIISRLIIGIADSIQQKYRKHKMERVRKKHEKRNTQSGLCSTMCRDIANDAVDTTQALIQSQQKEQ